jgi:hypothetical protein
MHNILQLLIEHGYLVLFAAVPARAPAAIKNGVAGTGYPNCSASLNRGIPRSQRNRTLLPGDGYFPYACAI